MTLRDLLLSQSPHPPAVVNLLHTTPNSAPAAVDIRRRIAILIRPGKYPPSESVVSSFS
jgi:hypothetical protein